MIFRKKWVLILLVGIALWLSLSSPSPVTPAATMPTHYADNGFSNPFMPKLEKTSSGYLKMRWKTPHPDQQENLHLVPRVESDRRPAEATKPKLTWIGHSTALIQYQGVNILTDPVFSERSSPSQLLGPKRYFPPSLTVKQLPPIHIVVISHNHYDHMDEASIRALGNGPMWFVPLANAAHLERFGIDSRRIRELDWWDSVKPEGMAAEVTVTATPSQHWSKRTPWDTNKALWSSWALRIADFNLWFGGDTGYNPQQFKEIGEREGPFDLALIPVGAYGPRWFMLPMHVDPAQAVKIHQDIQSKFSVGVHWGTFQLTAEPVHEPPQELARQRQEAGLSDDEFVVFAVGESRIIKR